ncbi:MerR family transcriptional regulator [Bacillus wiedmannii]|uniref:MerR family transcriptional regulator n=1 Tax=Bacillus cereus group TaxID=86661 RepID=UPI000BFDCA9E|nr:MULTISPECIES: MerR family transcriptional regulator [Bacillus cereus group]MEB9441875.1 MerR family transcriptional regulator [Bacillus cereus]PGN03126.1 DNA-binding protein [Bacillus cereus]TFZ10377.1 DNA-binding protein [Bacillus cereus]TKH12616.1 MerR family transcriptional regulator [Bacillus wiedmannii]
MEYGYFAQEVAKQLDINTNTLRRWSIELEKMEYIFERNERNQRIYYENDIDILKQMKEYLNQNWKLEEAATRSIDIVEENAKKTDSVQEEIDTEVTLQKRSQTDISIIQDKFSYMFNQQEKIVQQNQDIINLLLQERSEKEEKDLQIQLLQEKLDKTIQMLNEDRQEQQDNTKKTFIQRLFNRN